MDEKGLDLKITISEDLPDTIQTDNQRLQQIIKNLLSNAIKFTEKGSVAVDFRRPSEAIDLSRSGLVHSNAVAIAVTDTGLGIPDNKQHSIFEAFQQADGSTSRKFGGTGLGLSISREMASLLGGEIHLTSEENAGSTFTVYISDNLLIDQEVIDIRSLGNKDQKVNSVTNDYQIEIPEPGSEPIHSDQTLQDSLELQDIPNLLAGKTVLIVDDDMRNNFAVSRGLEQNGMIVIKAANGLKAIEALSTETQIDIVLMDVMMPIMDGYEAMEKIRQLPALKNLPILALTAKAMQQDKEKCIQAGANDYMTKPIEISKLLPLMQQWLYKNDTASV